MTSERLFIWQKYILILLFTIENIHLLYTFKKEIPTFISGENLEIDQKNNWDKIDITIPLSDAIKCVKSNKHPNFYMKQGFVKRKLHFEWIQNEIKKIIPKNMRKRCRSKFCGPWVEDEWIKTSKKDFHFFGPFIPLFVPWEQMWYNDKTREKNEYIGIRDKILKLLSKEFFYVTLSTNNYGIEGQDEESNIFPDNLIIISSGGRGHIPILKFMTEHDPKGFSILGKYRYDVMYSGYTGYELTKTMIQEYSSEFGERFKYVSNVEDCLDEFEKAKFILAPRGNGHNSYRLTDILQTGRVPIYIYDDIIWLPYYNSIDWSKIAIITNYKNISKTFSIIKKANNSKILKMRTRIRYLYDSYFTKKGTFNHIGLFFLYGFQKSDLRCSTYSSVDSMSNLF